MFEKLVDYAKINNQIAPELYPEFNVKRGLRNEDGSGVLVGLTKISDVTGYEKKMEFLRHLKVDLHIEG